MLRLLFTLSTLLASASATSFMTPESEPPVTISAWAAPAAELSPTSKARCSRGWSVKAWAPPVTEMMMSGRGIFQLFMQNEPKRFGDVVSLTTINGFGDLLPLPWASGK